MAMQNFTGDFNSVNVFDSGSLQDYGWSVVGQRKFSPAEVNAISSAVVRTAHNIPGHPEVEGRMSVCFFLKRGGCNFIPVGRNSQLTDGQNVNVSELTLLELTNGSRNILHVE